jgi:hypothetical protein
MQFEKTCTREFFFEFEKKHALILPTHATLMVFEKLTRMFLSKLLEIMLLPIRTPTLP